MANVHLVGHLLTSESYLVRVDYDDVVTTIHMRSERRLVLTTKNESKSGSKTAYHLVGSIDHNPLLLDITCLEGYRFVALCVHLVLLNG